MPFQSAKKARLTIFFAWNMAVVSKAKKVSQKTLLEVGFGWNLGGLGM